MLETILEKSVPRTLTGATKFFVDALDKKTAEDVLIANGKGKELKQRPLNLENVANLIRLALHYLYVQPNTDSKYYGPEMSITALPHLRSVVGTYAQKNARGTDIGEAVARAVGLLMPIFDKFHQRQRQDTIYPEELDVNRTIHKMVVGDRDGSDMGSKHGLSRWFLYHDKTFYTSMPFSPPSEELPRVLKLEVGNGCNYGKCTYCTQYGGRDFFVRSPEDFRAHTAAVAEKLGTDLSNIKRVFLAGGNIFSLPADKLLDYISIAKEELGKTNSAGSYVWHLRRLAAFGRTESILTKKVRELNQLGRERLRYLFWGLETGSDAVLDYVHKRTSHGRMIEAGKRISKSYMKASVMIMPGLGGLKHYKSHVLDTAKLLNTIKPRFITFLTINPATQSLYAQNMAKEIAAGKNRPLTDAEIVEQMYDIMSRINTHQDCLVASYRLPVEHVASNPVGFRGRLEFGEQSAIKYGLRNYFRRHTPSKELPSLGWFHKPLYKLITRL